MSKPTQAADTSGVHWIVPVTDLDFDAEGRIVIKNPQLAKQIKEDISSGKHIFVMAANSGEYCVKVSSQTCFVREG
jgi:hypothetical protein